jgi:hypothetical protein
VPCPGGIAAIDGSTGEFPGHSKAERLEFIALINELYVPRWTITPEVITHKYPWNTSKRRPASGPPLENDWLAGQPLDVQTAYVVEAMRMLKDAGITPGGLTMCWSYPADKNHVLGEATLRAARQVCGLDYVIVFNDTGGDKPEIIFQDQKGGLAVSMRCRVGDRYRHTFGKMQAKEIQEDADYYITEDGTGGKFVEEIKKGICLLFYTHMQTLFGDGTKSGFEVYKIALDRLHKHYGHRLHWMTGVEICRHFSEIDLRHKAGRLRVQETGIK